MEGKAGMAAIVDEEACLNFSVFENGIKLALSSYSRPIFLRVLSKMPMTCKLLIFKTFFVPIYFHCL